MELDSNVYYLINVLLKVILWSLIISAPAIILTVEMYAYEKYKKWKDTEIKEKEKIILGRAKKIVSQDEELQRQADERKRLELDVELLMKRKKALDVELGNDSPTAEIDPTAEQKETTQTIDLESMNIKQLKSLAKKSGFKMYSKKNKSQLLKLLKEKLTVNIPE